MTADRDKLSDQEAANPEKLALQSNKLQKLRKAYQKRGIVYVSRIPPHMVRHAAGMHLFDASSVTHTLTYMHLNCRNLKNCASCWSNMVLLASSIVRLKVGMLRPAHCMLRPAHCPRQQACISAYARCRSCFAQAAEAERRQHRQELYRRLG